MFQIFHLYYKMLLNIILIFWIWLMCTEKIVNTNLSSRSTDKPVERQILSHQPKGCPKINTWHFYVFLFHYCLWFGSFGWTFLVSPIQINLNWICYLTKLGYYVVAVKFSINTFLIVLGKFRYHVSSKGNKYISTYFVKYTYPLFLKQKT